MRDFLVSESSSPMMQSKMEPQPSNPQSEHSGLVWVKCPYPLMDLALKETLKAAHYDVYRSPKGLAVEEAPLAITLALICRPNDEAVAQEVKRLREVAPDVSVLVLGFKNDLALTRAALQAGARGFLHLEMQTDYIVSAISLAVKGELVVSRELVASLVEGKGPSDLLVLTARQREILELVAEGLTNAQIAKRLFLTEGTVKQHLRATYKVLGVHNRTKAARLYRQNSQWEGS